ncbi:hypothetical protein [Desulfosediminicola flagellatus]|uniref:hypothetical protein n=1 Tax=Desulfosediminicola flagellatus TaxID=2569541 RepID=UPI0012947FBF|nr:hypothetical protein [Desulfosediminicola flagellatus]
MALYFEVLDVVIDYRITRITMAMRLYNMPVRVVLMKFSFPLVEVLCCPFLTGVF